jgi:hypothetical protein
MACCLLPRPLAFASAKLERVNQAGLNFPRDLALSIGSEQVAFAGAEPAELREASRNLLGELAGETVGTALHWPVLK